MIIKQGASGATAFGKGTVVHQPPVVPGDLVDSTGAGDAFDAGCSLGVLEGWPVQMCMRFAAAAAGFTLAGVGGSSTFPTR
jgi:sugar/nucleoside kinase (ribokinase family)